MAEMMPEVPRSEAEKEGKRSQMPSDWMERPEERETQHQHRLLDTASELRREERVRAMVKREQEEVKRSKMPYDWMKRPEESEAEYQNRLIQMNEAERAVKKRSKRALGPFLRFDFVKRQTLKRKAKDAQAVKAKVKAKDAQAVKAKVKAKDAQAVKAKVKAKDAQAVKAKDAQAVKAEAPVTDAGKPEESVTLGSGKSAMNQEVIGKIDMAREKEMLEALAERRKYNKAAWAAAKAKKAVKDAHAAKPEEPVTDAAKPEESVTVGSGRSAREQADDEEILQEMLQFKLDHFGDSFIQDEAEEKQRRAELKEMQEEMARRKKDFLLHLRLKVQYKARESAATVRSSKSDMEKLPKDKLDKQDLEEDSNRTTQPAADHNSAVPIQDDHVVDKGKSALAKETADEEAKAALAKETADEEEEAYQRFRKDWESSCCKLDCDHFNRRTMLSSMQFTHCTPGMVPYSNAETLQIFSMKLKLTDNNAGGFEFPLSVYGLVAVRDALDSRRNILFSCDRTEAQVLTQDHPFLHFTGPSRAIVSEDKVYFEIRLRVKGAAGSQDKPLITCARAYDGGSSAALCYSNLFCTLEVCLQTVEPAVQATIVGVQFVKKNNLWPSNFTYGGQVACTLLPRRTTDSGGNQKIVLIESKGREMPQGDCGYLPLSRQVVCVERRGGLDVSIQAYDKSGDVDAEGHVLFKAQNCQMSQQQCIVGQAQVTVTVAWSIIPTDLDSLGFKF